uniref:Gustatory receptor n=1 Tax=Setaria digitata TaxID=48799 RepID=A0A915PRH9_9BILA
MPFLKIDFSTHDSNNLIQKHLQAQFVRYFSPVQLVLALLCCRITCLKQKNQRPRWIGECHTFLIILFLIIILLIAIIQFWFGLRENSATSANPPEVVISILQLQGILNLCFLVYWDRHSIGDKLRQRLQATSTGIGVLRRKSLLNNIHVLRIIANNYSPVIKVPLNFDLPHYLHWLFVGIFVYVAFSYPAIYAEVYSLISIICAEYRALNDDFADDCNTYQLPVIRHYVNAHWNMSQSHALFSRSLSLWMSFHLLNSLLCCIFLLRSISNLIDQLLTTEPITLAILICAVLLIIIAISQIVSSIVTCLLLCHDMIHFRYLLILLVAGTTALHEQTYSVAIAYINHLYRSRAGISFFEITIIDRKFIEKAATVVLLISAMYYFNNFDKYPSKDCREIMSALRDAA